MRIVLLALAGMTLLAIAAGCSSGAGTVSNNDMVDSQKKIDAANGHPPGYNPQGVDEATKGGGK